MRGCGWIPIQKAAKQEVRQALGTSSNYKVSAELRVYGPSLNWLLEFTGMGPKVRSQHGNMECLEQPKSRFQSAPPCDFPHAAL